MLLARSNMIDPSRDTSPAGPPDVIRSDYVQSRELWRLRASLAETESFSDVVRMDDIASSPEVVTSSLTTSFESNEVGTNRRDVSDAGVSGDIMQQHHHQQLQHQQLQSHQYQPQMLHSSSSARYVRSPAASLLLTGESRRQAYRRAIAQRWSAKTEASGQPSSGGTGSAAAVTGNCHMMAHSQQPPPPPPPPPETSFDSIDTVETDGDVSDTSCSRPEITTTSFDSTTTTTTDNNTDDVDAQAATAAGHRIQMQYDSGYKSIEVPPTSTAL